MKKIDSRTRHITPAGGNIFLDLGFPPDEAAKLKAEAERMAAERHNKTGNGKQPAQK